MPQTFDPNLKISREAWREMMRGNALASPMIPVLATWKVWTGQPTPGFARTQAVLAAVADLMGNELIASLRAGVTAQDPRALAAVEQLAQLLSPFVQLMRKRCFMLNDDGRFRDLLVEAVRLRRVAEAAGIQDSALHAQLFQAAALGRLQNAQGAIAVYRAVVDEAPLDNKTVRGTAHHNLAKILLDIGDYDGAIKNFTLADADAETPEERYPIMLNRSRLRQQLGDLAAANDDLRQAEELLKSLQPPASEREWGTFFEFKAHLRQDEGKLTDALALTIQAQPLLQKAPAEDRATNAMDRAGIYHRLGQDAAAERAFDEALALADALAAAEIDECYYRAGYRAASARRLPLSDEAFQRFVGAVDFYNHGDVNSAKACYAAALQRACQFHDVMTSLRVQLCVIGLLAECGEIEGSIKLAENARQQAM